eukprot:950745-Amphidinium_carterae.1
MMPSILDCISLAAAQIPGCIVRNPKASKRSGAREILRMATAFSTQKRSKYVTFIGGVFNSFCLLPIDYCISYIHVTEGHSGAIGANLCSPEVCLGRFNSGVYKAYTIFFIIGTLGAIQIPVVGLQPIRLGRPLQHNNPE